MIKMKMGGVVLTGFAAFLLVSRVSGSIDSTVNRICDTAKWRGYYRCWSKGKATGEPIAPGYSVTSRPVGSDYETVKDPEGKDHSKENGNDISERENTNDPVKYVTEAVRAVAEKAIDNLGKKPERKEEASEGQTEASESDISVSANENKDQNIANVIDSVFRTWDDDPNKGEEIEKERDQDETLD